MAVSDLNKGLCKIATCSETLSALTATAGNCVIIANVNTNKDQFFSCCVLLEDPQVTLLLHKDKVSLVHIIIHIK